MEITEVSTDVFAVLGPKGSANAGFIIGNDMVIAIDTMMSPRLTTEMIEGIKQRTSKPVRFLINTHYHGDHISGNNLFADATIIAHNETRRLMVERGESLITMMFRNRPEIKDQYAEIKMVMPALTYDTKLTMYPGNMTVEISFTGRGHTPGDTIVYIPEKKVLFASDLIFFEIFPMIFPEGSLTGWINALTEVIKIPADVVVSGHGRLCTTDDLKMFRAFLQELQLDVTECFNKGMNAGEALKNIEENNKRTWTFSERLSMCVNTIYGELKQQ